MNTYYLILIAFLFGNGCLYAQLGCTDPLATNYNSEATVNDGSCVYNNVTEAPETIITLEDTLDETSGIIAWNGQLLTHNDDADTDIYAIDALDGTISDTYSAGVEENTDWEEIAHDNDYIYLGDFGNNNNGNRTNLHIIRVSKSELLSGVPDADCIEFHYKDQNDFSPKGGNNTNFDCEAFIVGQDSIYLFTKRWVDKKTSIYSLPKVPGNYTAQLKGTYNINGLVTGGTYIEDKRLIVLSGYSSILQPFVYLLYDFEGSDFFSGNKRKIQLSAFLHQTEGIATTNGTHYYVTNERFMQAPGINIDQKLHYYDLSEYLATYLENATLGNEEREAISDFIKIYPNPAHEILNIDLKERIENNKYYITDMTGKIVMTGVFKDISNTITIDRLVPGMYIIKTELFPATPFKFIKLR